MDKINIKFTYDDYEYCYRIPSNFNWFEMFRVKRLSDKLYLYESIIFNDGNIFLNAYMALSGHGIIDFSYRTEKQRESILNNFIKALIINKGKDNITLEFANKLNINVNNIFTYNDSLNVMEFLNSVLEEINNNSNVIKEAENVLNNNPYTVLGIENKEYSKEELSNIFNDKMNMLLDAYNYIKKNQECKKLKR